MAVTQLPQLLLATLLALCSAAEVLPPPAPLLAVYRVPSMFPLFRVVTVNTNANGQAYGQANGQAKDQAYGQSSGEAYGQTNDELTSSKPEEYKPAPVPVSASLTSSSSFASGYGKKERWGKLLGLTKECMGKKAALFPAADCGWYNQCSNGLNYLMPCPYGLQWSQQYLRCVYPSQSDCGNPPPAASFYTQAAASGPH